MPNLEDIRAFVAIGEAGGLAAAGRRLSLTKSVMSRRLARLEADIGVRLLARNSRGVSLTEGGATYLEYASRIIAESDAADEALAPAGELRGRLRIAAPLSAVDLLGPLLAEFAVQHSHLEMQVSYSDKITDVVGEGFDAAVRGGFLSDSTLLARRLTAFEGRLVASPGYLARRGAPRSLAELMDHDAVLLGNEAWPLRDGDTTTTLRPRGRFKADSGHALVAATEAGLGIALLPAFLTTNAIAAGRLVTLLPDHPMPPAGFFLVRPPGGRAPRKVSLLADFLTERLPHSNL